MHQHQNDLNTIESFPCFPSVRTTKEYRHSIFFLLGKWFHSFVHVMFQRIPLRLLTMAKSSIDFIVQALLFTLLI